METSIYRLETLTQEQYNAVRRERNKLRDKMQQVRDTNEYRLLRDQVKYCDNYLEKAEDLYPKYEDNFT